MLPHELQSSLQRTLPALTPIIRPSTLNHDIDVSASYPSSCSVFIAADRSDASSAFFPASQCRLTTSSPTTILTSHFDFAIPRHFHLVRSHCASCVPRRIVIQTTPLTIPLAPIAPVFPF